MPQGDAVRALNPALRHEPALIAGPQHILPRRDEAGWGGMDGARGASAAASPAVTLDR